MEEKNPQQPKADSAGPSEQPNRNLDQMGTHGGPAQGSPPEQRPASQQASAGPDTDEDEAPPATPGPAAAGDEAEAAEARNEGDEESGSPGAAAAAAGSDTGMVSGAISRVKSIARGLMQKKPKEKKPGPRSQEAVNEERGQIAQAMASKKAAPKPKTAKKATAPGKSVRGGKNKADKAGKVGKKAKAGRVAAARGAKKGTRGAGGKVKKQAKRPVGTQSRQNLRGRFAKSGQGKGRTGAGSGKGGGRGAQKGARGKSGAKRRPSPRKGTK